MTTFKDAHDAYATLGWPVLYLRPGTKYPPPPGYTGRGGKDARPAERMAWAMGLDPNGNIAVRMPEGVIGLDVDAYGPKLGESTLVQGELDYGPLPASPASTARTDGVSGIRFYRIPPGVELVDRLGPGVEIIQRHHRYAVVWPSVHPEGGEYRWAGDHIPAVDELPELPAAWVEGLRTDRLPEPPAPAKRVAAPQCPFTPGDRVAVDGTATAGTVTEVASLASLASCVMVRWDDGGTSWTPWSLLHEPGREKAVDVTGWAQLEKVDAYASMCGIERAQAVRELVELALGMVNTEIKG